MNEPVPTIPAPRQLRPEETHAFADLGLQPGDWEALHPLPVLEAVRRTDAALRPGPDDWLGRAGDIAPAVHDWRRQLVPDTKDAPSPKLTLGLSLLAWHLATDRSHV